MGTKISVLAAVCALAALPVCDSASEPAQDKQPAHYVVSADISMQTGELTADVTITLPPSEAGGDLAFVLGERFRVHSVEVQPRAQVRMKRYKLFGRVPLQKVSIKFADPLQRPATLRFKYHGPLTPTGGSDRLGYTPDALELAMELFWIPFRSELNLRFTADTELRGIPESMVVVAQGEIEHKGDRVRLRRTVPDLDLPMVAASCLTLVSAPGMEFYTRDPDSAVGRFALMRTTAAAEFMQSWLGPIPHAPARVVVVPRSTGGAYARVGYIVTAYAPEPGQPAPQILSDDTMRRSTGSTMAHELAHGWWSQGDTLSEDYWLTESLAEYSALRYVEALFGHQACEKRLVAMRKAATDAGPILDGSRPTGIELYQKGPLLLFDLEERIGRSALDQVFKTLAKRPPSKTSEFLSVLSDVAGADAAREFEAKLR